MKSRILNAIAGTILVIVVCLIVSGCSPSGSVTYRITDGDNVIVTTEYRLCVSEPAANKLMVSCYKVENVGQPYDLVMLADRLEVIPNE